MMTEIRCLSVRQPWSACIASGQKVIENRTRTTNYRGLVAIHSSITSDRRAYEDRGMAVRIDDAIRDMPPRYHAGGVIIAVAEIVDAHRADNCCDGWAQEGLRIWHWRLENARQLVSPVPAKGRLGLWKPDADVTEQIAAQLELEVAR